MGLHYKDGLLSLGETELHPLLPLAEKGCGRPFYVYDLEGMVLRLKSLRAAAPRLEVFYALKANGAAPLLKRFLAEGTGIDTVSAGEIKKALSAGFTPGKIIFSGVGKTKDELRFALEKGIAQINVESPQELKRIAEIAMSLGKKASIAFRMNPDVDPKTHPYITTGFRENKFGMDPSFLPELKEILRANEGVLELQGLTIHIGSQIRSLEVFEAAISRTKEVFKTLRDEGFPMKTFDVGGGVGIDYEHAHQLPSADFTRLENYGRMVERILGDLPERIFCEPGRILVAASGALIGEVQYSKKTPYKNFLVLNTGIHHLIRPALYQAKHRVLPLKEHKSEALQCFDVVGPICESSDVLARGVPLPDLSPGEFVAIADAGAYGYTMASGYNDHELPEEVFV